MCKDDYACGMIVDYLEQVHYWLSRFETSRDIDHLENAESHAEVVRSYLPSPFKDFSVIALSNLHQILSIYPPELFSEEKCISIQD